MKVVANFASGQGVSGLISLGSLVKDLKYPICPGKVPDFSTKEEEEQDDESDDEEPLNEQDLADLEGLPDIPETNHDPADDTLLLSTI